MTDGNEGIRKLSRSSATSMVAGVCGGLEEYFRVDVSIFRILFAVSALFGGFGIILYVLMWLVVPLKRA